MPIAIFTLRLNCSNLISFTSVTYYFYGSQCCSNLNATQSNFLHGFFIKAREEKAAYIFPCLMLHQEISLWDFYKGREKKNLHGVCLKMKKQYSSTTVAVSDTTMFNRINNAGIKNKINEWTFSNLSKTTLAFILLLFPLNFL